MGTAARSLNSTGYNELGGTSGNLLGGNDQVQLVLGLASDCFVGRSSTRASNEICVNCGFNNKKLNLH